MREWLGLIGFVALTAGCAWAWAPLGAIVGGAVLFGWATWGHVRYIDTKGRDK